MSEEYTPTEEVMRLGIDLDVQQATDLSDWFIAHDAEVAHRAEVKALRDYAKRQYLDYLESPEVPWLDQPEGVARQYAKAAEDLLTEAARIEEAGHGE